MSESVRLFVDHLDIWSGAIERKNGAGYGNGGKLSLYGIEKLRSLILDQAVRGKLVPQDPMDEPASELLKKLDKQCAQLSMRKFVSRYAERGGLPDDDRLFEAPSGWEWVNVAKLGHNWGQVEPKSDFTYIDVGSIDQRAGRIVEPSILEAGAAPSRARKIVKSGTVIYSTVRPYLLNIAIVDDDFDPNPIASTAFAIVHPFDGVDARYIYRVFRSPFFMKYVEDCQTGIAYPAINDKQFFGAPFPLPPFAEQKRIVTKVDELMALCDALEKETREAITAHEKLVRELLATLVNSQNTDDLAENWSRIEVHFDTLFASEESIDALRQTILELAVRGKLVPQLANDEPAEVMLKLADKAVLKRNSKRKLHPPVPERDQPFELPSSWRWVRFDNLIQPEFPIAYGVLVPGDNQPGGVPFVRIADLSINDPPTLPDKAIKPSIDAKYERTRLKGGEILMGVVGSIGKLGVAPDTWAGANIARAICRIVPSEIINRKYVLWLLQSRFMQDNFTEDTRTLAQPTLNLKLIRLAPTPVPPYAEQQRIVAKVDELMAQCDALTERLMQTVEVQKKLADTVTEVAEL